VLHTQSDCRYRVPRVPWTIAFNLVDSELLSAAAASPPAQPKVTFLTQLVTTVAAIRFLLWLCRLVRHRAQLQHATSITHGVPCLPQCLS
jgi:hypothetical protein